jgi:hypothetical protein
MEKRLAHAMKRKMEAEGEAEMKGKLLLGWLWIEC